MRHLALLRGKRFWSSCLPLPSYGSEMELGMMWGWSRVAHGNGETEEGVGLPLPLVLDRPLAGSTTGTNIIDCCFFMSVLKVPLAHSS